MWARPRGLFPQKIDIIIFWKHIIVAVVLQTRNIEDLCVVKTQRPLKSTVLGVSAAAGAFSLPKTESIIFDKT